MKGHTYYLFDPAYLDSAVGGDRAGGKDDVLLCGDSLGLAQPLTAEGILPAVISGRLAAEAILAGAARSYPGRLAAHPVLADYWRVFRLLKAAGALGGRPASGAGGKGRRARIGHRAVTSGFAWMFSGARLPTPRLVDAGLAIAEQWAHSHRRRRTAS